MTTILVWERRHIDVLSRASPNSAGSEAVLDRFRPKLRTLHVRRA